MEKIVTIPRDLARNDDLVLIPRKTYKTLLENQKVTKEDVLRWTKETMALKRIGRLPKLRSWSDFEK